MPEDRVSGFPGREWGAHVNEQWDPPVLLDPRPELPPDMVRWGPRHWKKATVSGFQEGTLQTRHTGLGRTGGVTEHKASEDWVARRHYCWKAASLRGCEDLVHVQMDNYVDKKSWKLFLNRKKRKTTIIIFNLFLNACFYNLFSVKRKPKSQIPYSVSRYSAQSEDCILPVRKLNRVEMFSDC